MSRPFELFRDDLGVPHVRAGSEADLAYGQGYVTALDRGWQLDVDRWYGEGRLAARVGPAGLEWDRFAVRVRLADTTWRVWEALAAPERDWLAAYADGVQAGLDAGGRDTPERAELARAFGGAPLPVDEPWRPWTPVGTFLVHHVLFSGFGHLLWREHVARTLGRVGDPALGAAAVAWWAGGDGGSGGPSSGSNAWALHGSRTASGAPLLAGDPHRFLELPGVYQQVRLARPGHDVVGLAFPGVPGVLHLGQAETPAGSVAWGITNAMAHHVELFVEGDDGAAARAAAVASGAETVPVRGGDAARVPWAETPRGPLVTDRHSLRWPVRVTADAGVAAWRTLQGVRTARDVAAAFAGWVDPVNRVLAADSSGEVLRLTAGRVPVVPPAGRVLPRAVEDATRSGHARQEADPEWLDLPAPTAVVDVAVDANERPDRPDHDLGIAYAPHRAERVRALLAVPPPGGETARSQVRVHADTRDGGAPGLVAWLEEEAPGSGAGPGPATGSDGWSDAARTRAERLRAWAAAGAPTDAADADAALFSRWRDALVRRVAADPALAPLHAPHGLPAVFSPWLDVVARVGDALAEILASGVVGSRAAAAAALADLDDLHDLAAPDGGADAVTWGDLHRLAPLHALDLVPGATAPVVPRVPLGGTGDAVRCTGGVPGVTTAAFRGSVARWVWDLGDRRRSRWGVPFGASGDPRSPHFADQHPAWAAARTTVIETDWARLRPEPVPAPTDDPRRPR